MDNPKKNAEGYNDRLMEMCRAITLTGQSWRQR